MNTGKVLRFAGSHRILYALSAEPKTSKELKVIAGAIYSIAKFDGEYMMRLYDYGYVRKNISQWCLTSKGRAKLDELGPVPGMSLHKYQHQSVVERPIYNPSHYKAPPMRPGSEDFLAWPSRIGNRLFYRDGTVRTIEE